MQDYIPLPENLPPEDITKYLNTWYELTPEQRLEAYKTHRDRVIQCVKLLDMNTREFPHYRNAPYWAKTHLMQEWSRLERIISMLEAKGERSEKV